MNFISTKQQKDNTGSFGFRTQWKLNSFFGNLSIACQSLQLNKGKATILDFIFNVNFGILNIEICDHYWSRLEKTITNVVHNEFEQTSDLLRYLRYFMLFI